MIMKAIYLLVLLATLLSNTTKTVSKKSTVSEEVEPTESKIH